MFTVDALLSGRDASVRSTYDRLVEVLREMGPVAEEAKKTSVHLVAGTGAAAFAGVHPRRTGILLNLRTAGPIASPRVRKTEQISRNRWFNEVLVETPGEVDAELLEWVREAYTLSAARG